MQDKMQELRVELNQKISRQEARVDSWAAEIMKQQKADAERADNSSLAKDVERLAQCVTDLRTHHDTLIMEVESEVTSLRVLLRELRVADASDSRFAELHNALKDQWQESRTTLQTLHADIERVKRQQDEVGVEALNKSNMVLMHAQRDMNSLRELLDQGLAQKGSKFEEEAIETLRDLRAEVDLLGRRHDEFGADLAKKDGQIALQVEAHFGEVQKALQQQASLQAEVEFLRRRHEEFRADLANKGLDISSQIQAHVGEIQISLQQQQALQDGKRKEEAVEMIRHFQTESAYLRQKHEDFGTELANKDASISKVKELQADFEKLQISLQQQQAIQDQTALAAQVTKEAQRLEVESLQQHLQKQRVQLDALHAAAKAEAEVRDAEVRAMRQEVEEVVKKLSAQVANLDDFTKKGLASVQNPPRQPGDEAEVTSLRTELSAMKQNMGTQQSLQAAEMAKDAYTLHGQLQKVLGTERDARIQESIEVRALIRHLYEEMSLLNNDVKAACPAASSLGFKSPAVQSSGSTSYPSSNPSSEKAIGSSGSLNSMGKPTRLTEPLDIKQIEVTRYIGQAHRDRAGSP